MQIFLIIIVLRFLLLLLLFSVSNIVAEFEIVSIRWKTQCFHLFRPQNYTQSHRAVQTKFFCKMALCVQKSTASTLLRFLTPAPAPSHPHYMYLHQTSVFTSLCMCRIWCGSWSTVLGSPMEVWGFVFLKPSSHKFIYIWRAKMTIILFAQIISIAHLDDSHNNKPHRTREPIMRLIYGVDIVPNGFVQIWWREKKENRERCLRFAWFYFTFGIGIVGRFGGNFLRFSVLCRPTSVLLYIVYKQTIHKIHDITYSCHCCALCVFVNGALNEYIFFIYFQSGNFTVFLTQCSWRTLLYFI